MWQPGTQSTRGCGKHWPVHMTDGQKPGYPLSITVIITRDTSEVGLGLLTTSIFHHQNGNAHFSLLSTKLGFELGIGLTRS